MLCFATLIKYMISPMMLHTVTNRLSNVLFGMHEATHVVGAEALEVW